MSYGPKALNLSLYFSCADFLPHSHKEDSLDHLFLFEETEITTSASCSMWHPWSHKQVKTYRKEQMSKQKYIKISDSQNPIKKKYGNFVLSVNTNFLHFNSEKTSPHNNGLHCRYQHHLLLHHIPDRVHFFSDIHLAPTLSLFIISERMWYYLCKNNESGRYIDDSLPHEKL